MKSHLILVLLVFVFAVSVSANPGDTITSFTLSGQPSNGVRGLDMDWSDGNIWAAGPADSYSISYGKFDPVSHAMVGSWATMNSSVYWCFDIGYGYESGGTTYLLVVDQNSPFT